MRLEKASVVSDLSEKLKRSPFVLVTDYQHMKVGDFGELRNRLAPAGAEVHVVKNNFLKRAMTDSGFPDVGDKLVGQTAVVRAKKIWRRLRKFLRRSRRSLKLPRLRSVLSIEPFFPRPNWKHSLTCRRAKFCRRNCWDCSCLRRRASSVC